MTEAKDRIVATSLKWFTCMGEFIDSDRKDPPDACYEKMSDWEDAVCAYNELEERCE